MVISSSTQAGRTTVSNSLLPRTIDVARYTTAEHVYLCRG